MSYILTPHTSYSLLHKYLALVLSTAFSTLTEHGKWGES